MTLARLMIALAGAELPRSAARRISQHGVAGVTLFRVHNVVDPPQMRRLTASIQQAPPAGAPLLLVASDQQGGQLGPPGRRDDAVRGRRWLSARPAAKSWPSASPGATARELRALGVNMNYAPACDVATKLWGRS